MAQTSRSPYGTTKSGYIWDTDIREYIDTRTGEIVSAADAVPVPEVERRDYRTGSRSFDYEAEKRFRDDQAIDIIRRQAGRAPRRAIIVIRGLGGTEEYEDQWWSSEPMEVEEFLEMDDDEIAEFLYGLTEDGPEELDILFREEEE